MQRSSSKTMKFRAGALIKRRLCLFVATGMNIARALGDKFLKGQNVGLSAHPHVSRVHHLTPDTRASLVMARYVTVVERPESFPSIC